ncbi:MAG TPA: hypothetical protein VMM15_18745 [Bradyrhizobium sp.]|nr:hypothetical protein [Bradyrhizobium sp.]
MSQEKQKGIWSQLPAVGALVLGCGALLGLGQEARADQSRAQPAPDQQSSKRIATPSSDVAVRLDGEIISISQDGRPFEELRLENTPEAAYLRKLLRDAGAVGKSVAVSTGAMIVASGGGSGKGEKPSQQTSKTTGTGSGK